MGSDYSEVEDDHQVAYLRTWAKMVGIAEVHAVLIEGTLFGPKAEQEARDIARGRAEAIASILMNPKPGRNPTKNRALSTCNC